MLTRHPTSLGGTAPTMSVLWLSSLLVCALVLFVAGCGSGSSDSSTSSLPTPSIVSLTPDDGTVTVEWSTTTSADTYDCLWATEPVVDASTANVISGCDGPSYTVTGLTNGETYHFAVRSMTRLRTGKLSKSKSCTLAPSPVTVSITAGDGSVTLSWDEVYGALRYDIYRGTSPGVTTTTGDRFTTEHSPYIDTNVVNGTSYYYVVVAVGLGGSSAESSECGAKPQRTVGAPLNPTVTEGDVNTLVISWSPPSIGSPDSYNIYWDTVPGVIVGTNQIADVTSPYTHTGLAGKTTYYYVVTAVEQGVESPPSVEVSGEPKGEPSGETYGNNVSLPLVFANGYGITGLPLDGTVAPYLDYNTGIRPLSTDVVDPFPYLDPTTIVELNGISYYAQKTASTWQPAWRNAASETLDVVVDWGDNLASSNLKASSNIRVETTLYQDTTTTDPTNTMTGYNMVLLGGSGITESWGTDGVVYESNRWNVFSVHPRLQIQKLLSQGGEVDTSVQGFDAAVYESFTGAEAEGAYGGEVNVSGKVVYGYVWMLKQWPLTDEQKVGWWRITFSLDKSATIGTATVTNNVNLVALDPSDSLATLDAQKNSTSIEVNLQLQ